MAKNKAFIDLEKYFFGALQNDESMPFEGR